MSIETPTTISVSPLRSPIVSRTSSFVGKPRKPSPLRRSSTPDDSEVRQRPEGGSEDAEVVEAQADHEQGRRASDGHAILSSSSHPPTAQFTNTSLSKSTSSLSEMTLFDPKTKTTSNTRYTIPPIRATPKFPHSPSIRPLRPLSSVTGPTNAIGSLTSVPHAGFGTQKAPQRQKIIVPSKSWKACFDLNLTQKELARFD